MGRSAAQQCLLAALILVVRGNPLLGQCPDGSPPPCGRAEPRPAASVAVLPFRNLTADSSDAYLAAGMTEELTSRLGEIGRVRVAGAALVSEAWQQSAGDRNLVSPGLNVQYVIEGSVRKGSNIIRVSVRLLRARDGVQVWAATYDRADRDMITLQDAVARDVVQSIAGTLLPVERATLGTARTRDPVAYRHYLRGLSTGGEAAVRELDAALRRDPRFAAAEARRARIFTWAFLLDDTWAPRDSLLTWGLAAADRALLLDSTLALAWYARGYALTILRRDFASGRMAFERAVQLDNQSVELLHALAVNLKWYGLDTLAETASRRCIAADPSASLCWHSLAEILLWANRREEAAALFDTALTKDPEQTRPRFRRAGLRYAAGDLDGAEADLQFALRRASPGQQPHASSWLVAIAAVRGDSLRARQLLAAIPMPSVDYARALVLRGKADSAIAVLEQVTPNATSWYELRFPEFAALMANARFRTLVTAWRPR